MADLGDLRRRARAARRAPRPAVPLAASARAHLGRRPPRDARQLSRGGRRRGRGPLPRRSASARSTCRPRVFTPGPASHKAPTTSRRRRRRRAAPVRRPLHRREGRLGRSSTIPGELGPSRRAPAEVRAVYVAIAPWKIARLQGRHAREADPPGRRARSPSYRMLALPDHRRRRQAGGPRRADRRRRATSRRRCSPARCATSLPKLHGRSRGAADDLRPRRRAAASSASAPTPTRRRAGRRRRRGTSPSSSPTGRSASTAATTRRPPGRAATSRVNLALSVVLAAVVAGGVLFALRAASREMKLSQMKSDFVSNVSHELRTPLASIRVFGELLRLGRVESPEKVARVRRVHRDREPAPDPADQQHPRLLQHRVGPQELPLRARPTSSEVVARRCSTFGVRLRQSGFRLAFDAPAEPLPPVRDRRRRRSPSRSPTCSTTRSSTRRQRSEIEVGLRREGELGR